jgi:hypothetical protein
VLEGIELAAPGVVRAWMGTPPTWVEVRPAPSDAVSMITDDLDLDERAAIALAESMSAPSRTIRCGASQDHATSIKRAYSAKP